MRQTRPVDQSPTRTEAAQTAGPQLVTQTKFMQQYRIGAAVHGGGDIAAVKSGTGAVEVFTVGTDEQVWDFYADPSSGTGIQAASTTLFASAVTAGRNHAGRLVLFAADHLALNYVVENAPGSSTRWGAVQTAQIPLPAGAVTISAIYTGEFCGTLYVGALIKLKNSVGTSYGFVYSIWDDGPGVFNSTTLTLSTLNCVWSGHSRETAQFTCLDTIYLGYDITTRQVIRYPFAATFTSVSVATTLDQTSNNRYFAVLNDGNLYQMVGGVGGAPFSWAQLTQQKNYRKVMTAVDPSGGIHLFALSTSAHVWHLPPSQLTSSHFADPMVIQTNVALMTSTALDDGAIQLFLISTAQATMLQMVWQATSGNWQTTRVEVPTSGQVDEYVSYSTDLLIFDAAGALVPNAFVQVTASAEAEIIVNGASYTVSPTKPANLTASAAGAITVTQQTNCLAIPTLEFNIGAVPSQSVAVQQFAEVQEKLDTVTGSDLMNAKLTDGSYMLPEAYRTPESTNSLAQACNETMAITKTGTEQLANSLLFSRQGKRPGVGVIPKGSVANLARIAVDPTKESAHWQLSFSEGSVAFRKLTANEAHALILEKQARNRSLSDADGFLDWLGSIGDFIAGVAEGLVRVVDTVISTIGEGVRAVISFIANGVEYIFDTIVDYVEQAFDLVEVFFAQVTIFFDKLFQWLGFIFNWGDILRSHQAIAYTANQYLGFLPLAVSGIQKTFDGAIANIQTQIAAFFDRLVAEVGGGTLGGYVNTNTPSEPAFSSANSNNIVLNSTLENASGATYAPINPSSNGPFDNVLQLIQQLVDSVESNPAFQQALNYMTNLGASPDQIFVQLLSALLRVIQGLAQAMIAGVQVVVDAVLQLVQAFLTGIKSLLNEEWKIPFVSDFYSWLTDGSSLTLLDLLSLIVAIPATVLYKVMYGKAPFPDDASVAAFKASFSSQTILNNSGLVKSPSAAPAEATLGAKAEPQPAGQILLSIGSCLSFSVYGLLSAGMDVKPMTASGVVDPFIKTLTKIALTLEIAAQGLACPWIYGTGAPDCTTAAGVGAWFWIYESLGVILDAGFTWYESAFPENDDTMRGIVVAELYGVGHAILTAALGYKLTGLGLASKIVLVIPECCKFLRLPQIETATEGWSLPGIAALDGLCIPASGILSFADSIEGSPEPA